MGRESIIRLDLNPNGRHIFQKFLIKERWGYLTDEQSQCVIHKRGQNSTIESEMNAFNETVNGMQVQKVSSEKLSIFFF